MAKRKRTPQAPPTAAGRKKKKARETPEEASGAGPSQPPRSRPKKGARRGGQAPPVEEKDPNDVEGPYMVEFEVIPDLDRRIRRGHVPRSARSAALAHLRERSITGSGLSFALDLPVHRPHIPACLEFIQSAVPIRQARESMDRLDLPMEGTVRGRTVTLDTALVREAFVLPRASLEIKRQSLRREVFAVQAHLKADKPERYLETFVAIPLTHILLHLRLLTGRECDESPALPADPVAPADLSGVEAAPKKGLDVIICSGKSLVVRTGDCLVGFLEGLQKQCQIIIWSRLSYKPFMSYLEALVMRRYLPEFLLDPQACTVWGGDRVEAVVPRNNLDNNVKLKSFSRLHDHGICTRDVLLVDTALERNSRNHPYSEIYPRAFWGETPQPSDRFIIWSDVPAAAREILLIDWPHFHQHPEVEEAPPVEEVAATRVEGAPVDEAPPVEEVAATRVEGAPVEEAPSVEEVAATHARELRSMRRLVTKRRPRSSRS
ncbi:hypothetical protein R1sor_022653 [Riccia sorocarpa]|uniref:FCP1 homology domain-containing protein n=1 Tax=Riccia sorocarpa TaxID=122646 RepID=A0ABD3GKF2_9MARC